jgi:hypothetical protein
MAFRDRLSALISNIPGTSGGFTISTAKAGYLLPQSTDNGLTFDLLVEEGSSWELIKDSTYTHIGTSFSRGTFVNSSTGTAINFTSAAIISNVLLAQRMGSTSADIFSNTYYGGL